MTLTRQCRFATTLLTPFNLSLSMTHLLELPQRMQSDQQLWVRVTVIENIYRLFGLVLIETPKRNVAIYPDQE